MSGARWNLWPSPDAGVFGLGTDIDTFNARREREKEKGYNGNGGGATLAVAVQGPELWPTPTRADGERGSEVYPRGNNTLLGATRDMLPTPTRSDAKGADTVGRRTRGDDRLATRVAREMLPSPTASDAKGRVARDTSGSLNPAWVEWIMGFPINWTDPTAEPLPHPGWQTDPGADGSIPRVASDIPDRGPRLRALGNALVWQVAERAVRGIVPPFERRA